MKYNEACMKFSNEEIEIEVIECLEKIKKDKISIRRLSEEGEDLSKCCAERIHWVVFDGKEENLFISFFGDRTSIFVNDYEIMFIDEKSKGIYSSSDVYGNVVYAGNLHDLSHKEMLKMFVEMIACFIDAEEICIEEGEECSYENYICTQYISPKYFYINIVDSNQIAKEIKYENIIIKINI